jgi:hypothetical protein
VRFRRRGPDGPEEAPEAVAPEEETAAGPEAADPRSRGPWDASEVSLADDDPTKIDLGGLILTGRPTLEVQLQVDEASGEPRSCAPSRPRATATSGTTSGAASPPR